eukprot:scaffold246238_cov38-Tisochrysis_lutea.AAC.4
MTPGSQLLLHMGEGTGVVRIRLESHRADARPILMLEELLVLTWRSIQVGVHRSETFADIGAQI